MTDPMPGPTPGFDNRATEPYGESQGFGPFTPGLQDPVAATLTQSTSDTATSDTATSDTAPPEPAETGPSTLRSAIEWISVIVSALAIALLIKAFAFQAFEIPSGSMQSTLNIGDRILVNKLSYTFGEVERGDLTVFSKLDGTQSDTEELIKRVIALPGETLEVRNDGRLWVWGPGETEADARQLDESFLDLRNQLLTAPSASDPATTAIWDASCTNAQGNGGRCTLDGSSYFMMGDNRTASTDSRFFGPVPDENVVGRAVLRIWPLDALGSL